MNLSELQIIVLRMTTMNLLDGEVESGLVAFPDHNGQDINAKAETLAAEHGAVLLEIDADAAESATLYIEVK